MANIPDSLRWISNFVWGSYYIEVVRDALLKGGGWSRELVFGDDDRRDWLGVLFTRLAEYATNAVEGITEWTTYINRTLDSGCVRW